MDNFDLKKYLAEGKLLKEAPKPYTDETRKGEVGNLADDIELEGDARQKFISDLMKATKDGSWDTFYDIADKIMVKYLAEGRREPSPEADIYNYELEDEDMDNPDEDLVIIGSGYLDIKSNFRERPSQTNGEYAEIGQKVVDQLHKGDKDAAFDYIMSKIN
jgi:hypothetical protein